MHGHIAVELLDEVQLCAVIRGVQRHLNHKLISWHSLLRRPYLTLKIGPRRIQKFGPGRLKVLHHCVHVLEVLWRLQPFLSELPRHRARVFSPAPLGNSLIDHPDLEGDVITGPCSRPPRLAQLLMGQCLEVLHERIDLELERFDRKGLETVDGVGGHGIHAGEFSLLRNQRSRTIKPMSDFSSAWTLSRSRFIESFSDLNHEQLNWKVHSHALTIGQMALHVAGVEFSFASQLTDRQLSPHEMRLKEAATNGVVNDHQFPFQPEEITLDSISDALDLSKSVVEPIITDPSEEILSKQLVSALGPVITGEGAFTRLAFHAAYHQGQAYLIRTSPAFPA